MMVVPDAWDECGGCGHDRDDHDTLCDWPNCTCRGFQEATS